MTKVAKFEQSDVVKWIYGAVATFIGGGAGAISAGFSVNVVDPKDFAMNSAKLWTVMLICFIVNGVLGLALYLKDKPLPALKEVETAVQTVTTPAPGVKVTTTVKETHSEPSDPTKKEETENDKPV